MRNIATCYSEHAVKVSDSYCSGPLNRQSYVSPKPNPSIQNSMSHTYKAKLSLPSHNNQNQKYCPFFVTITWFPKLVCQGFSIKFSYNNNNNNNHPSHVGPHHQMGQPMGHKQIQLEAHEVDLHWDLSSARFGSGPEPLGSYYIIIILVPFKMGFIIGDRGDDPLVKELLSTKYNDGLSTQKLKLISQYEQYICGGINNPIISMAGFSGSGSGSRHEIVIRVGPEEDGPRSPVLSILVDKKRVVRVKRLQWNFRGNQVIFIDGLLVDVMWDVFGWYFDSHNNNNNNYTNSNSIVNNINDSINFNYYYYKNGKGCGMFMFRTRSGLDSRLWLEEEERKKLNDKDDDKPEFSLLICAYSKNNPG